MKKLPIFLISMIALAGLVSCAEQDESIAENSRSDSVETAVHSSADSASDAESSDSAEASVHYHLNEFDDAFITYLCLNGYDSSNFLISPAAFRASLCLATVGAQGSTRAELLTAAGFSGMDSLDKWYSSLPDAPADSVWSNADLIAPFTEFYTSKIASDYRADACSAQSNELAQAINAWVAQKTGNPLSADYDVSGASALLISTMHLQTAWTDTFADAAVYEGKFTGRDGKEQRMRFAEQTGEYLYAEENGIQALAIPIENNMSFVCFLGNRTGRFDIMENLQPETVHVVLPIFELESTLDARDLLGFLFERGINDAASSQTANFYNMCSDADWFIQEMIQKVSFSTGKKEDASSSKKPTAPDESQNGNEIKSFIAETPFSFAVISDFGKENQHVLLYGQMSNSS